MSSTSELESNHNPSNGKNFLENQQWEVLGGLRFVLASIVLCTHCSLMHAYKPEPILIIANLGALVAVLNFLTISGFSIAASVLRDRSRFYLRRFWRIIPVYLFSLTLSCLPWLLFGPKIYTANGGCWRQPSITDFIGSCFFLQGILVHIPGSIIPAWTIGVEVLFYIFAPILIRMRSFWLLVIIFISSGFYVFHRTSLYGAFATQLYGFPAIALLWAWLLGLLLFKHPSSFLIKFFALTLGLTLIQFDNEEGGVYAKLSYFIFALILANARIIKLPPKVAKVFYFLGELSFPLYLTHWPILLILSSYQIMNTTIELIFCFGVALLTYCVVDLPCRRWQKKLGSC